MALLKLRVKTCDLLMRLACRVGSKSNFHLLQCPLCTAQFFMIDGYLYCYLNSAATSVSAAFKLDLEMSDAVVTCRRCGEEIDVKDAAIELLNLVSLSGAQWMGLQ